MTVTVSTPPAQQRFKQAAPATHNNARYWLENVKKFTVKLLWFWSRIHQIKFCLVAEVAETDRGAATLATLPILPCRTDDTFGIELGATLLVITH